MHNKQWLSKQGTWPNKGLLGCGEHGCLGLFENHEYEVVGSSNRSILYLGKQAESYKAWYMHPLACWDVGAEGVVDRNSHRLRGYPREHTRSKHWKGNQRRCIYYYEAITSRQDHEGNTRQCTTISHLPSRAVTNRLSEVSVTNDDTAHLSSVQVV